MKRIRDGLGEWHHDYCRAIAMRVLSQGPIIDNKDDITHSNLLGFLAKRCGVRETEIARVLDILAVTRTHTGVSRHRSQEGVSIEVAINFGGLEEFVGGGEFEEYASFAADPVIGSRWVQNVDEALLLTFGHELAHYIVTLKSEGEEPKPHGDEFKSVYALIRQFALNPMLDEFAMDALQRANAHFEARLIRKIQALKKMAEDPTSNENEAERAVVQLQALMAKHGLNDSSFAANQKPHVVERTVPIAQIDHYKPLAHVCWSIAEFCGVEAVIHTRRLFCRTAWPERRPPWVHTFLAYFGAPADTEMAVYLSELIFHSLFAESTRYRETEAYRRDRAAGHHSRALVSSFRRAFVARINKRLKQSRTAVENEWVAAREDGRALMTHKDSVLQALFKARYPRLQTARESQTHSASIDGAVKAGRSAADRVNLNRPMGHAQPRLLGHLR